MTGELTVHTMPLGLLRARAREAERLIAQAREIARHSFDARSPSPGGEEADASILVGQLLDAAQRLLPGIPSLVEERPFPRRAKAPDSGWRRVTLRGGAERAMDTIERARILEEVEKNAAGLVVEIERGSSSMIRAAHVAPSVDEPERARLTRGS